MYENIVIKCNNNTILLIIKTSLCILLSCTIFILYLIVQILNKRQNKNLKRHLTNEYHYAHFSKITKENWFLKPSLLFTCPIRLKLKVGQSLWIPKGWWHWIESKGMTTAINFWSETSKSNLKNPIVINSTFQDGNLSHKITKILHKQKVVDIWKSDGVDRIMECIVPNKNNNNHNNYIISLPGYGQNNPFNKLNKKMYKQINKYVNVPYSLFGQTNNNTDIDMNFWISLGDHDTGLHYDDYDGLLCMLKGEKNIILYPPSDTKYLEPICVIPEWAKNYSVKFEYNTYTFINILDDTKNLPSSRLLYETVMASGNKKILQTITMIYNIVKRNNVIWGCKFDGTNMRWEVYMYHYDSNYSSRSPKTEMIELYLNNNSLNPSENKKQFDMYKTICYDKNLIIHSFDIYKHSDIVEKELHLYYKLVKNYKLPFIGKGTCVNLEGNEKYESNYILDKQQRFYKNLNKYLCKIGYTHIIKNLSYKQFKQLKKLINLYSCDYICIHNKNQTQIFIQYLGITINDYIDFLRVYNYPCELYKHVIDNKNMYENINHEITIVFDIQTLQPIRTAFYGIL